MVGSRRAYAIVFLLVVGFILYGSLYPFQFHAHPAETDPFAYLLSTWRDWDRRGDLVANILLYIPFGFFGVCAFGRWAALPILLAAAVLATGVELGQFHDQGRVTSMGDVYADTIGGGVGVIVALAAGAGRRWPLLQELWEDPPAAFVLFMWFGYRLYPYVPVSTVHKYLRAFAPFVMGPPLAPIELFRFIVAWTGIGAILNALYGFRRAWILLVLLIVTEFVGRILIIDATLQPADVLGAGLALAIAPLLPREGGPRLAIVAFAFAGMIVVARLAPFVFSAAPGAFGWVPFVSFLRGSIGVAIQAFCEKFFKYGGLIWLLRHAGLRTVYATILTAALLFVTSLAEIHLPGRSAEVTDAVMALAIGGVFALLTDRRRRPS
jgi:VanZ family protein